MRIYISNLKIYRLQVDNAPRRFIIDKILARFIAKHSWKYVEKLGGSKHLARASIKKKQPRVFLHKYIVRLAGKKWQEVFFTNSDPFDCRLGNLAPYRRDEEGATRRRFKGKRVRQRGVFLKRYKKKSGVVVQKFGAAIRVRGKYKHLGYFPDPEIAARAYRLAFKAAHPNLIQR